MNFEKTVQSCFDYYPNLFQTREQVLNHIFCIISNGYHWTNGELINTDSKEPMNNLDENGKAKIYHIITKGEYRKYLYELILKNPRETAIWNFISSMEGKTLEEYFLSPRDNDNEPEYKIEKQKTVYSLCLNYSYLFNYPENIKPDWLQGIKETFEYIINNIDENDDEVIKIGVFNEISKQDLIKLYHEKFG